MENFNLDAALKVAKIVTKTGIAGCEYIDIYIFEAFRSKQSGSTMSTQVVTEIESKCQEGCLKKI